MSHCHTTVLVGIPGAGKTTRIRAMAMEFCEKHCRGANGVDVQLFVGSSRFITHTKTAARHLKNTIAAMLNEMERITYDPVSADDLINVTTLHAECLRLGQKNLPLNRVITKHEIEMLHDRTGLPFFTDPHKPDPTKRGDQLLSIIQMARAKALTIEEHHNNLPPLIQHEFPLRDILFVAEEYEKIKKERSRCDFTDMLVAGKDKALENDLELVVVDEAQDLSPLQWEVIDSIFVPRAKSMILAGDDDQTIFGFSGVDVSSFGERIKKADTREFLFVSHRAGRKILEFAYNMVNKYLPKKDRIQKDFSSEVREEGVIETCLGKKAAASQVQRLLAQGTDKTIFMLGRTAKVCTDFKNELFELGILYKEKPQTRQFGKSEAAFSVPLKCLRAVLAYRKIQQRNDACLSVQDAKDLLSFIKCRPGSREEILDPERDNARKAIDKYEQEGLNWFDFLQLHTCLNSLSREMSWYEVMKVPTRNGRTESEMISYISKVISSGVFEYAERDGITFETPVTVLTIHGSKGLEADIIFLCTETIPRWAKLKNGLPDAEEVRVWHTAITRAKSMLVIVKDGVPQWIM